MIAVDREALEEMGHVVEERERHHETRRESDKLWPRHEATNLLVETNLKFL